MEEEEGEEIAKEREAPCRAVVGDGGGDGDGDARSLAGAILAAGDPGYSPNMAKMSADRT